MKNIKKYVFCAIFGAIGFILMLLEFSLPFVPSFIKFDFSEIPAVIASFAYGPIYGVIVCFLKNLFHLFISSSVGVGEVSNFLLGAVFTFIVGFIYKYKKCRKTALLGLLIGAFAMALVSVFTNYFIVYPIYAELFMPMDAIFGAYKAIIPSLENLFQGLLIINLPFNFIKGLIDAGICFLIYKKISPILKSK